jgi:steroid 5-alpha reductase family enzyme
MPDGILTALESSLNLSRASTIIFLGTLLPSFSFGLYNALWRREHFPMTGQGGAVQVTTQVNFLDVLHAIIFVYTAARNPTWSGDVVRWTPPVFLLGIILHVVADHSKYLFRRDRRNDGKVFSSGVWRLVRHPNYLGFTIWRVAFATAAGGWAFGALLLAGFMYLFADTAVPVCEEYMAKKYGIEWRKVTEKVRWRMIPGLW